MITDLEKKFFKVFDIKPKYQDTCTVEEKYWANEELANEYGTFDRYMDIKCGNQENCTTECSCAYQKEIYPQITDRQYLELICIDFANNPYKARGYVKNIEELKNYILEQFIHEFENDLYWNKESVKHQVQAIFKESEQE